MLTGYNHLYQMKNDYALIDFHIRQSQSPKLYIHRIRTIVQPRKEILTAVNGALHYQHQQNGTEVDMQRTLTFCHYYDFRRQGSITNKYISLVTAVTDATKILMVFSIQRQWNAIAKPVSFSLLRTSLILVAYFIVT